MAMDVRAQACAYARNGAVNVTRRDRGSIDATVHGHARPYEVHRRKHGWTCQCGEPDVCPHVAAVQLVTGYPGLASPRDKKTRRGEPVGASR